MVSSDFELNLPTPIYPKQQLGVISNRSRLDAILEKAGINYEQYILYVEAFKVSTSKPKAKKPVFLVLTQEGVTTIRREG
jgi:hypothetical protein